MITFIDYFAITNCFE